jgi:AcrR family transcriptional regulator
VRAVSPSDAPRREPGTRTRSGNAMARTRAAVLRAAAECVERYGVRRTTMVDVASKSGVAKATLYNHFRTKDDVLAALVEAQVAALLAECAAVVGRTPGPGRLAAALSHAALSLSTSRPLRRVAADEPALLAALAAADDGRAWQAARGGVAELLHRCGAADDPAAVDVVLRWVTGHLSWPSSPDAAAGEAAVLAAGLVAHATIGAPASGHD